MKAIYFGPDIELKHAPHCPVCGVELDGVTKTGTEPGGDPNPSPGDFSVCIYCGALLRFDLRLELEEIRREDMRELLEKEPEQFALLQKMAEAARTCIRERRQKRYARN